MDNETKKSDDFDVTTETDPEDKDKKKGKLKVKVYSARNSLLTDLLQEKHIKPLYNFFIAFFIGAMVYSAMTEYVHNGQVYLGTKLIINAFSQFHMLIVIWTGLFLSSIMVYYGFVYWVKTKQDLKLMSCSTKLWDTIWLVLYVLYIPGLVYYSTTSLLTYNLGPVSTLAILAETVRFIMKTYAFVRSNCPKYLKMDMNQTLEIVYPTFSQYMYFSFAPVLLYRDSYPRTTHNIRWNYVAIKFLEQGMGLLFASFLWENSYKHDLQNYGLTYYTWVDIALVVVKYSNHALLMILIFFYCGIHCYSNAFAEMLSFSDRMFYEDWWTSTSMEQFLRTWNVFVYDWLYVYIFKDFYEIIFPERRNLSKLMVFLISAIAHDYILCFTCRLFLPISSIMYLFLIMLKFKNFKNNTIGNVVLWGGFGLQLSFLCTICSIEYYARINCRVEETLNIFALPRFLQC